MIYFDNSATTKPYKEVIDAFVKVSNDYFGNPSSLHRIGGAAENLLIEARSQIAKLLNVRANEVFFTSGGTESNNLAIKGTALMYKGRGKHIVTTAVEHSSTREAIEQLKKQFGFQVTYVPVDTSGRISPIDVKKAIRDETILVTIIHVNNEIGTIQPIQEIGQLLRDYPKILFHVDHIQGVGKVPLNMHEDNIDLYSISGHKFHALKGTGALLIKQGIKISPLFSGGSQELKIRSGTENVAGIVAMAKALRLTFEKKAATLEKLTSIKNILKKELEKIERIIVHTPSEQAAPHILNFSVRGIKAEVFLHALEEKEIYVSTTSACSSKNKAASNTLLAMGVNQDIAESAIRISLTYDNTIEEAKAVIKAITETVKQLGEVMN
ncbi:cysteine desulfurase [Bacillus aquiflavi]|uniref:Cysteine desulfurase n=1 Tax=Bacillus aquiflavi TaxID=2672567 RepID=A0A6B3W1T7_9BACI|nr:cysteine desulfurase family protein [Bacillus aquiflavi]MBA4537686.1 cysteine desulfurase [Bacillus aquiflavi]NEY81943.1 cysteine desulfurase [Bacillus aquiflavi]